MKYLAISGGGQKDKPLGIMIRWDDVPIFEEFLDDNDYVVRKIESLDTGERYLLDPKGKLDTPEKVVAFAKKVGRL